MKRALVAAAAVALVSAVGAAAYVPGDPLAPRQWYLAQDRVFDYWPTAPADLQPVRVAVVDSGIDGHHPDLAGRVVSAKSFVGGSPWHDRQGHGTFVAGVIAATVDNGEGIAGMAPNAELIVAKVVNSEGVVPLEAEVAAIRWAADEGARVINLSLGGVRDPLSAKNDTYSPLEEAAVEYAVAKGAVVVAAVGNGPQSPETPWPYAHYPAALPHVLGVAALAQDGSVPDFSNRDSVYVDIAAPGEGIVSTLPRRMTAERTSCQEQGYSLCGPFEFRTAEGTSFAAPQVSAAAALVLGLRPDLRPEQVSALLERTADDVTAASGCRRCPLQRDRFTGWGRLDVLQALEALGGPLPPADRYETNDDAGPWAPKLWGRRGRSFDATLDFWDDQIDVYRVRVGKGRRLFARLQGLEGVRLEIWKPATATVEGLRVPLAYRAAQSSRVGVQERVAYTAQASGWYYLEVKLSSPGSGAYRLSYAKA